MPQTDSRLVAVGAEDKALGLIIPGSAEDFLNTDRQYATLNGKKVFFQHFHEIGRAHV